MNKIFLFLISFAFFSTPTFAAWTIWVPLGGDIVGDPAACTARGDTYVAAKGTDNAIWYRKRTLSTGIWDAWKRIPGTQQFSGSPSVACRIYLTLNLFEVWAVGFDGQLYQTYQASAPNSFTPWAKYPLNGITSGRLATGSGLSTPSLVDGRSSPQVFARGSNNSIYQTSCVASGNCYNNWVLRSPIVMSDAAATYQSAGRLDLAVLAINGTVMHRFMEGGIWQPYYYVGSGPAASAPDIVSRYQGSLDLFYRSTSNALMHKRWINGVWGNAVNLSSPNNAGITSGPGAVTYASKARIFAFARGSDGALWYRAWAP